MISRLLKSLILLIAILASCITSPGDKEYAKIVDDRLELTLDSRWSAEKKREVSFNYGIDTLLIETFFTQNHDIPDSLKWRLESRGKRYIRISKPLTDDDFTPFQLNDLLDFDQTFFGPVKPVQGKTEKFGINLFRDNDLYNISDSVVTFRLKGYSKADNVFISGSFNNWSTMNIPMVKEVITDNKTGRAQTSVWKADINLKPGRYTYKYIVDGKWISDPGNEKQEEEDGRGRVSVFYMPSNIFELASRPNARKVALTGNFINWSKPGIPMIKEGQKWILPVYLANGTWTYKFIADREWITDPENPDQRSDADGNMNSFLSIGEKHLFRLKGFTGCDKVILTGSFNDWNTNELVMEKDEEGWKLDYSIDPGIWEYKFITDGEWRTDPANPYTTGSGDHINSILVLQPNHVFVLEGYNNADNVIVTGNFNNWDKSGYRMIRDGNRWIFPVRLENGKWLYKFVMDGEWILDPSNEDVEENEYGTGNSVLWVNK
jgi:hypothetical protein